MGLGVFTVELYLHKPHLSWLIDNYWTSYAFSTHYLSLASDAALDASTLESILQQPLWGTEETEELNPTAFCVYLGLLSPTASQVRFWCLFLSSADTHSATWLIVCLENRPAGSIVSFSSSAFRTCQADHGRWTCGQRRSTADMFL